MTLKKKIGFEPIRLKKNVSMDRIDTLTEESRSSSEIKKIRNPEPDARS